MHLVELVLIQAFLALATACQEPLYISGVSRQETSNYDYYDSENKLNTKYGSEVMIFCTGPQATQLSISLLGAVQDAEVVNATTIRLSLKKPDINRYTYICTGETCEERLTVDVHPELYLLSPSIRQKQTPRGFHYFVPIDEDYQVACSGNAPEALSIHMNGEEKQANITNETRTVAVNSMEQQESKSEKLMTYSCKFTSPSGVMFYEMVHVYVDYPPEAKDFWCVEYVQQVNCTWLVSTIDTSFRLLYSEAGETVLLCENLLNKRTRLCEWGVNDIWNRGLEVEEFAFVMQACNPVFCAEQTFNINRHSVIRPKSPYGLEVLNTTSRGAVVKWRSHYVELAMEYNLEYQLLGTIVRELDETSLRAYCEEDGVCEGELDLPCPDTLYLLKVYTKLTTTANYNVYWSAPATIAFHTDADGEDVKDPICDTESELIDSGPIAAYEVRKFARYFEKEGRKIRQYIKIDVLKPKLAEIRKIRNEL